MWKFLLTLLCVLCLGSAYQIITTPKPVSAQFYSRVGSPNQEWAANHAGVGASLAEIKPIPSVATQRHVITMFINQSTTSTANQWSIQSGTGTNCGTATTAVLPGNATNIKYIGVTNAVSPQILNFFATPVRITAGHAVCVLGIATQLTRLDMFGYTTP
jgi:hypothetical protein